MKLTEEQKEIVAHKGNLVIEAGAGCGKTSTLVEKAKANQSKSKLYIAYNKATQIEGEQKFKEAGVEKIKVVTAHGLAYKNVGHKYKMVDYGNYKVNDILDLFKLSYGSDHDLLIATYVLRLYNYYANSAYDSVSEVPFSKIWEESADLNRGAEFVRNHEDVLVKHLQKFWSKMDSGEIPIDHNFYLKKYQLSKPTLSEDIILADECLPYGIPVLLADGTSKPIGEIVENKLPVEVLAYNTETKKQEICKVTNWQKLPNNKPMVKIVVRRRSNGNHGHFIQNFVVCTTDHKIWTNAGWVEAGKIKPGMIAQVETAAKKTHKYKISSVGRSTLSTCMYAGDKTRKIQKLSTRKKIISKNVFRVRGGNGTGLTEPQKFLLGHLSSDWEPELAIKTDVKSANNPKKYPPAYKVDLGNKTLKIAVELDGHSHKGARLKQDIKKDALLRKKGWQVFRYKNVEVFKNTEEIVKTLTTCTDGIHCPVDAEVMSIEETHTNEYYVYDITVERCHNFYANGILVHNCQDLNEVMLDILLRQKGDKIMVGDPQQSLYLFRFAINAMSRVDYDKLHLSGSFRFGKNIEKLANKVLKWKEKHLGLPPLEKPLTGLGPKKLNNYAILCRTNSGVLNRAIQAVFFDKQKVSYEGNISSYMFASDSSSIYDVLNFYCNKRQFIKNKLFNSFQSWDDLKKYVDDADDRELNVQCNMVQKYGGQLYTYLKELKNKEVPKKASDVTVSTVHKAKGQEYAHVTLDSDFRGESWFSSAISDPKYSSGFVEQEVNVNYVAVTRAASNIEIPEDFFASDLLGQTIASFTPEEKEKYSVVQPA